MTTPNIVLTLFSNNPETRGQAFRKYTIDDQEVVGAHGDELFGIRVRNLDNVRRALVVSVDGVNVLTGKPATPDDKDQLILNPGGTLELDAWVETMAGGRKFVFTSPQNGAARHAIADESQRGIIAVSCHREGYQPPQPKDVVYRSSSSSPVGGRAASGPFHESATRGGGDDRGLESSGSRGSAAAYSSKGLRGGSAVGAGEYTSQRMREVPGLRMPIYEGVVSVRHVWYDELVVLLREHGIAPPTEQPAPGFFAPKRMADLGSTPTVGTRPARVETEYPRFT